jgi:formate hydrogenlyase transcriptional activator
MSNSEPSELDRELASFERLTADISSRFNLLSADELPGAIEGTLQRIVEALDVDRSTVFELSETEDAVDALHSWARPDLRPLRLPDVTTLTWFLGRLRRGETVRITRAARDIPPEATAEHSYVEQAGQKSNLTIPVSLGGRLVSALAVGTFRRERD